MRTERTASQGPTCGTTGLPTGHLAHWSRLRSSLCICILQGRAACCRSRPGAQSTKKLASWQSVHKAASRAELHKRTKKSPEGTNLQMCSSAGSTLRACARTCQPLKLNLVSAMVINLVENPRLESISSIPRCLVVCSRTASALWPPESAIPKSGRLSTGVSQLQGECECSAPQHQEGQPASAGGAGGAAGSEAGACSPTHIWQRGAALH